MATTRRRRCRLDVVDVGRAGPEQHQHDHPADQQYRVHRRAALLAPVDVLEVQDQGELVEHQGQADAEGHAGQRPPPLGLSAEAGQPAGDHQHDPGHGVVDVHPADHVVLQVPSHPP